MANTKKLRANAQKFRKENPNIQAMCAVLIQRMADFIRKTDALYTGIGNLFLRHAQVLMLSTSTEVCNCAKSHSRIIRIYARMTFI